MLTDRQREIIHTAMRILVEQGTQKLTIRNVATAIGVSEPAVYRHFTSKHDLLVKLLETLQESILPIFREDPGAHASSLAGALDNLLNAIFKRIEENPAFALFVFTEEAFHADEELRPILARMLTEMMNHLEKHVSQLQKSRLCRADVLPRFLAGTLLGLIRLTVTRWHLDEGRSSLVAEGPPLAAAVAQLFATT